MNEITYLKLKVMSLEYQNMLLRLDQTKQTAKTAYENELRTLGLDPTLDYRLDDTTSSATPIVRYTSPPIMEAEIVQDAPKEN